MSDGTYAARTNAMSEETIATGGEIGTSCAAHQTRADGRAASVQSKARQKSQGEDSPQYTTELK